MSNFEITILGVGDSFSERHHPTALLLEYAGFRLAVDCPDMYRSVLKHAAAASGRQLSLHDIDHVLITHVHGDHMNGLEGVAFHKHFIEKKPLALIASTEVRSVIWEQRLKASMSSLWDGTRSRNMLFGDYFEHQPLAWSVRNQIGPFSIRTRRTIHHVPTSALLVEAGGRTLGYSSDTAFDPELIAFLEPADLIIHETNLGPAHTPYERLAALPAELRSRMLLIHYSDGFDVASSSIRAARQGEVLSP